METIEYRVEDGVALIGINVPGRSLNILTPQLQRELVALFTQLAGDDVVKGVVIHSAKTRGFIAGADLMALVEAFERGTSKVEARDQSAYLQNLTRRIETLGKPVATAIGGLALGGGLELALGTHYRVLSNAPDALIGLPEVTVGLLPGGGGTQRLARLIGVAQALPMLLDGKPVGPEQALKLGIVDELASPEEVVSRAKAWVLVNPDACQPWDRKGWKSRDLATLAYPHGPLTAKILQAHVASRGNYPAPLAILSCVSEGMVVDIDTGLCIERNYFAQLLTNPVSRNLIRTQFINKSAAEKLVRRPASFDSRQFSRIGVLGAGQMGAGIARVAALAGMDVVLLDTSLEQARAAHTRLAGDLARQIERGQLAQSKADEALARIRPTADYAELANVEWVIEAVFEDLAVKADVTAKAVAAMPAGALFASNTSTLPIARLAKGFPRPDTFIGLHFFSPVERMPLVEIIRAEATSNATLAAAMDLVGQLRKTPIVVHDSPGFFTSRVFGSFVDEGFMMLKEGVAPALIEQAARQAGMPVGPLAVADEVSLTLQLNVNRQAIELGLDERFQRGAAIDLVKTMVHEFGRSGRRSGRGFYEYPEGGPKYLWPELSRHYPVAVQQPALEALRLRFLTIQALESARCMEEGVVTDAADADLGSTLGVGFPSWTGGVLSYIDTLGAAAFVANCEHFAELCGERYRPSAWLRNRAAEQQTFHPGLARSPN
ncbi:3-hydroxyacyl-CoA dehydrogenase NAD-binding domain-containing protein [Pseudomonas sp. NFACC13-1]|uniref:3-hydroxyacyl-CoA dehydrogenase NAD-binding domain-containing protein n=1 Tax=Pseudomonas sp. NFACC13-1 TaxID=1566245 RepID=UPI0008842CB9|nr:3-hydroxyacyl-CoA dehydrogenase NAD-binding domain-containing protein [Pseudomonas sp. NFACC13-1]SDB35162.1 3-hydroxyacyl-CoA dehydrogenase / enoyl-CoA hydratase / 3-hydroxybutyryl-CoA epimerase [Pseudomonas sp. NFACC13-1]